MTSLAAAYWRLLHPLPSLLTVLVAGAFVVLAARGIPPLDRLLLLLAVETAMQFSISAVNDYFDRHVDVGRADKPVASGQISPGAALTIGVLLGAASIAMSAFLGVWVFLLTAAGLGGGLLYDAGLKYTALSWLPFALAFPTLPLWAWAGAHPSGEIPPELFWVWPVGALLVVGIHLADTIPDLAHDTAAGVRGLAHRLGPWRSLILCWSAFGGTLLLTLALAILVPYNLAWYVPGAVAGGFLLAAGMVVYRLDPRRLKLMSLLLEVGGIVLAVGWVAGIML